MTHIQIMLNTFFQNHKISQPSGKKWIQHISNNQRAVHQKLVDVVLQHADVKYKIPFDITADIIRQRSITEL